MKPFHGFNFVLSFLFVYFTSKKGDKFRTVVSFYSTLVSVVIIS